MNQNDFFVGSECLQVFFSFEKFSIFKCFFSVETINEMHLYIFDRASFVMFVSSNSD